jgi:glycosyltransferase involved in cell wall biosynthesis
MSKKKILVYADSPNVKTGFGTVSRNILEILHQTGEYDIDIFGINYHGVPHGFPYNIWPAIDHQAGDPYGRNKFCQFALQHDFDILWLLQDTFIVDFLKDNQAQNRKGLVSYLKENKKRPFKTIMYYPVDSIIKEDWYQNIDPLDKLVCYTEFGKQETLKHTSRGDIDVIYHGVNTKDFNVLPEQTVADFRKQYFGDSADKFIFMNVNRNQQRKDIPRTLQAFKLVKEKAPDTVLYLHMSQVDQGWNIPELCKHFDLDLTKDVIFPHNFEPNQAFPVEILNLLYNCADAIVSTTLGEGFGLGWVESMATKTPVIMPNNTAMSELISEDMGYLVDSGSNPNLWTCVPNDNDIMRPLTDVDDMVDKMLQVYNNRDEAKAKAEKAYTWVTSELDWKGKIADQWIDTFKQIANDIDSLEEAKKAIIDGAVKTEEF